MRLTLTSAQLEVLAKLDRGYGIRLDDRIAPAVEADVFVDGSGQFVAYGISQKGTCVELKEGGE